MKALNKLLFIACLFSNSFIAQDESKNEVDDVSQQEWDNIINYVNAEITGFSMVKYKNFRKRIKPAEQIDLDKFIKLLESNSREEPIPFEDIKKNIELNWNKTFCNISEPIEAFKSFSPQMLDSLFFKIEDLDSFKNLKLIESSQYADLKKEFLPTRQQEKVVQNMEKKEREQAVVVQNYSIQRIKERFSYNYSMIPTLLFLISTITLFVLWRKERSKYNELKRNKKNGYTNRDNNVKSLKTESRNPKIRNERSEFNKKSLVQKQNKPVQARTVFADEPKSPEIELIPIEKPKIPLILYAGKPTTDSKFFSISSSPVSGQTIYKLNVHEDNLAADFEIELVDQFITREVTNAPDEYLYRVCNQENSNKEFSREIITIKKGLAVFIDGNWVVKEANKATIKFQ